jgi:hypothetical protein
MIIDKKEIEIPKYDYDIFLQVLEYIYTGTAIIKDDTVNHLLTCSDKYGVPDLRNACFDYLVNTLDKNSVCKILQDSKKGLLEFDTTELIKKCLIYLEEHSSEVFSSDNFLDFDEETVVTLFGSHKICIEEIEIFKTMIKWGKKRCKKRDESDLKEVLKNLVLLIKYPFIESDDLIKIVKPYSIVPLDIYIKAHEYNSSPKSFQFCEEYIYQYRSQSFIGSSLISTQASIQLIKWINEKKKKNWQLIFKASRDGFDVGSFHRICDYIGETVVVIQSKSGHIFGGYNPENWTSTNSYTSNDKTFLFKLADDKGKNFLQINTTSGKGNSSYG